MNTELTLNEYQGMAMTMCMRTSNNAMYMLGNLCAEIGEAWGKIAKAQRHGVITIDSNGKIYCVDGKLDEYAILMAEVKKELGDEARQLGFLPTADITVAKTATRNGYPTLTSAINLLFPEFKGNTTFYNIFHGAFKRMIKEDVQFQNKQTKKGGWIPVSHDDMVRLANDVYNYMNERHPDMATVIARLIVGPTQTKLNI